MEQVDGSRSARGRACATGRRYCRQPADGSPATPIELPGNVRTRLVAENPTVLITSPWEYVAGLIAATASVFVWLAAQRRRSYFVDAACIHQTNRALKTQGIRHLAGFVAMSSQLVVLWDEHYCSRLWCVYELASGPSKQASDFPAATQSCPLWCDDGSKRGGIWRAFAGYDAFFPWRPDRIDAQSNWRESLGG